MNKVDSWKDFVNLSEEYRQLALEEFNDEYIDAPPILLDEYLLPTTTTLD